MILSKLHICFFGKGGIKMPSNNGNSNKNDREKAKPRKTRK